MKVEPRKRSLALDPRRSTLDQTLSAKLARVKLFLCDVDGVLTDATIFIGEKTETKAFNILDGLGMKLLQRHGIKVGWISNRPSKVTTRRGAELKIDFVVQQLNTSKVKAAEEILAQTGLTFADVCYVGDDIVDLALMKRAGVAVAVANAIGEAKAVADYVTELSGGHGAIREIIVLILQAQNQWEQIVQEHS